jgi:hypothetical protein
MLQLKFVYDPVTECLGFDNLNVTFAYAVRDPAKHRSRRRCRTSKALQNLIITS